LRKIKDCSRTFNYIHFPDLFQQCFYLIREYLWHSYVAVKSLVLCKLLYIVQSIDLEIFTHIYTNVTFDDGYYGLFSSSISLLSIKFSHCGNDDYEVLKHKHCQGPLTSNSKTLKALFCFCTLSSAGKIGIFSRTFKDFQGSLATFYRQKVCHIVSKYYTSTLHPFNGLFPGQLR